MPDDRLPLNGAETSFRTYALSILVVVYTFNFIDRQILSILMEAIKLDLGLSDTQLGLLSGFAFALFYATLGIPIARWGDRHNRRNLIALALAVWSAMTAISGLALNFWHLLLARIGVGVGEAGCSPPAHSIISDYYPPERRASALGVYSLGIPLGILFGFTARRLDQRVLRLARGVFRGGHSRTAARAGRALHRARAAPGALGRPGGYRPHAFGDGDLRLSLAQAHLPAHGPSAARSRHSWATALAGWAPVFFIRVHDMPTGELGTWLGLIFGIPGAIGIAWGRLPGRPARRPGQALVPVDRRGGAGGASCRLPWCCTSCPIPTGRSS